MLGDVIVAVIVGAIAGWVASKIMKTDESMGAIGNIVVGILGAFIGNLIARYTGLFGGSVTDLSISSIITAIFGAVILLGIVKLFDGRGIIE